MPERSVIVDTGPLVALISESDAYHRWAVEKLRVLPPPFLTCEAVLTEAFFVLARTRRGHEGLFGVIQPRVLNADFRVLDERQALEQLMTRYKSAPMSVADACLVRLAELHPNAAVWTLDSHFRIYRKNHRQVIPLIMPDDKK